jgi:mannose-6-phosphate isomerase-like protein (cupin superfamily)
MKQAKATAKQKMFEVLLSSRSAQAAMMTLRKGHSSSDEPEDEHPKSEQWLFVISGAGQAITGKRRTKLSPGSLLLIEKNEPHQIKQTGTAPLVTLNLYVPPAYTKQGDLRPSVT